MESVGSVWYGHSGYDDDLWRLLGKTDKHVMIGDHDFTHFEGMDYFHLLPIFVLAGASIKSFDENEAEGYQILVKDKDKFLKKVKYWLEQYCIERATPKQIRYCHALVNKINNEIHKANGLIENIVLHIVPNEFYPKRDIMHLISFLNDVIEYMEEQDFSIGESLKKKLEYNRNRHKDIITITSNINNTI